jgi:hypothetical protein
VARFTFFITVAARQRRGSSFLFSVAARQRRGSSFLFSVAARQRQMFSRDGHFW